MPSAPTALVIDDSRAMRMVVARTVRAQGFDVLEAANGREALDVLDTCRNALPRLALIDWNMPVMTGLDFVTVVRADPGLRAITLMMVTTEAERTQIVRALAAGAHEYLIKPFTDDALVEKLRMLDVLPGVSA